MLGLATKAGEETDLEKRTGDATMGLSFASIFLLPNSSVAAVIKGTALTAALEITLVVCGGGNGGPMGGVCFPIECDREESLDGGRGGASKAKGAKASFGMFEEDERTEVLRAMLTVAETELRAKVSCRISFMASMVPEPTVTFADAGRTD